MTKVSFPSSSTVTAASLANVRPTAKGCPALLSSSSYRMWMLVMDSFKFPITVPINDPSHEELLSSSAFLVGSALLLRSFSSSSLTRRLFASCTESPSPPFTLVAGSASIKMRSSSTTTGSCPRRLHGTLSLTDPRNPALTFIGNLRALRASGLSCIFVSSTSPCQTENLSASLESPLIYAPRYFSK